MGLALLGAIAVFWAMAAEWLKITFSCAGAFQASLRGSAVHLSGNLA